MGLFAGAVFAPWAVTSTSAQSEAAKMTIASDRAGQYFIGDR